MAATSFEIWWLWWDCLIEQISLFGQVSSHPCPLFNFFSPPAEQCCSGDLFSSSSTLSHCSAATSTTRTLVRTQVEMARRLVVLNTGRWLNTMQTYWRSQTKLMSAVKEMEGNISYPKAFAHSSITSTSRTATQEWSGHQSSLCPTGSRTTSWSTPGSTSPRHLLQQQQHRAQQQPQKLTPRSSGWPTRSSSMAGPPASSLCLTIPGAPGLLFRGFPFMASHRSQRSQLLQWNLSFICALWNLKTSHLKLYSCFLRTYQKIYYTLMDLLAWTDKKSKMLSS